MSLSTDDLIRSLADDLSPIKPMVRLREILAMACVASIPLSVAWLMTLGLRPGLGGDTPLPPLYLPIIAMLVLMALGGLLGGVAEAIPGRETAQRVGGWVALAGGLAAVAALGFTERSDLAHQALGSAPCMLSIAFLAVPCVILCARFIARGAPAQRGRAFSLACFGGIAIASFVIHLSCPDSRSTHLLLGHALAPALGASLVLAGVLAISFISGRRSD